MATRALAQVTTPEPPPARRAALACLIGCRRFVSTWALARCRDDFARTGKRPTDNRLAAAPTRRKRQPNRRWLADVDGRGS